MVETSPDVADYREAMRSLVDGAGWIGVTVVSGSADRLRPEALMLMAAGSAAMQVPPRLVVVPANAREAGPAITRFDVRHLFFDGLMACAILDWQMVPLSAPLASAELLEVREGSLVRSELIYDAQELRAVTQ
jgi:hypothetical protein